ncbi:MAG: helix-turn-helix domain-containing protein [Dehalococcoidia bacterium]|nr:helix-turn-helix domain-containing protein [Dehalococcoidia bacterium]
MLGEYVKETRSKRGLSQAELAKLADLSASFVCRIEKGDYKSVTVSSLNKLSRALKVPIMDLSNLLLDKSPKDDLLKKTPYEIINELSLSLPAIVPVYMDFNSRQILEYAFVPRELVLNGGREMKLIGIKSRGLEYNDIVHNGDIIICGKDVPPNPGDLCLMKEGENMVIAPYKKKDGCYAVIVQVVRVVKKLN